MAQRGFLGDMRTTLFERRSATNTQQDGRSIQAMCRALLTAASEVSGLYLAKAILETYRQLDTDGKRGFLEAAPDLHRIDFGFQHLLRSWFNRGFLVLRQISWETPASILVKIVEYEAVYAINDWDDLRRRLYPPDRRCFAYFHPTMPDEPLIFVEVALTLTVPNTIHRVLADTRELHDTADTKVAVFYSISNCQKALQGISFGNMLIK